MSSFAYILKRHQQNETVTGDVDGADSDAETHPRLPQYREYRESLKYRDSIDSSGSESDHEAVADDVTCSGIYSSDGDDSDSDEADHADKTASPRDNTSQIEAMSIDETTPLPRWQESRAKSRLIKELSNPMSDIHLLLGDNYGENNWKTVKFKQIHLTYADSRWPSGNFRQNVKRLLRHFLKGTGPFESIEETVEKWYTSPGNVSGAYALLFALMMDNTSRARLSEMSNKEIWESSPRFMEYEFTKFKEYIANMKKLTSKRRTQIQREIDAYESDMLTIRPAADSGRGYPKWNTHPASDLLREDESNGRARQMKPMMLWESRPEYKDFPLNIFRKHIYQEKMAQIAAPYWQHKRNQNAKKMYEESSEHMKEWHGGQLQQDIDGIVEGWGRLNLDG